jgi:hypothetical protein
MRMLLTAVLAVAFAGIGSADVLIDFDSFAAGTPVGVDFGGYGVTFWDTGTNLLKVTENYPGPPFSPPNSVYNYNQGGYGWHYWAEFLNAPATYVSVVMGDFDVDAEDIFLVAYDSLGNQVASDSDFLPDTLNGGLELEVAAPEIAKVEFWGGGSYPGSVYFDNFVFRPVPEPGAVSLIGLAVLGFAGLLKKRLA